MWAFYKHTFLRIQALIAVVTCAIFVAAGERLSAALVFFAVMQIGAVIGAMWSRPARRWLALAALAVGFVTVARVAARADEPPATPPATPAATPPATPAATPPATPRQRPGHTRGNAPRPHPRQRHPRSGGTPAAPAPPPEPDRNRRIPIHTDGLLGAELHQARSRQGDHQGARRRGRRRRAVCVARHLLDQLCVDADRGLPGHVHAGRLRAGRDRARPRQERCPHDVDELHGLRARHVRVLRVRLRVHVRRPQRHRDRRPGVARRHAHAQPHVHHRRCGQRRSRLGPFRHHRVLPQRRRLRRKRHRAVSVHDGVHGHHRDHRDRCLLPSAGSSRASSSTAS